MVRDGEAGGATQNMNTNLFANACACPHRHRYGVEKQRDLIDVMLVPG